MAKIASICDVSLEKEDVSKLFRLVRRTPNKKRPMLVSFVSLETKRKIMRNLSKLRDQNLSIVVDHDMTPEERRLNRELYLEAKRKEEANLSGEWIYHVRELPGGEEGGPIKKSSLKRKTNGGGGNM